MQILKNTPATFTEITFAHAREYSPCRPTGSPPNRPGHAPTFPAISSCYVGFESHRGLKAVGYYMIEALRTLPPLPGYAVPC